MFDFTIAKFGGSSVADAVAMNRCADLIQARPHVRLVVLSASAGVTNLLIELSTPLSAALRRQCWEKIKQIQYSIIQSLQLSPSLVTKIDGILSHIDSLSEAASLAASTALTDELVSQGEIMSTLIFSELLQQRKMKAEWFDVRQVMVTDDHFGKATPDVAKLKVNCEYHLLPYIRQTIIVTQGFIGCEPNGRTTTLGRGGSDYTAALLGEALAAKQIDIWTDVPGIYTTDPRIVPQAKHITEISFAEAAEMATFGAKILHPATLIPAMRKNIPVFVGASTQPELGGTIVRKADEQAPLFRALALRKNQTLLTLHSLNMLYASGFLAEMFAILAKHNISVDLITTSEVNIALTLDTTCTTGPVGSPLSQDLLNELEQICRVEIEQGLSLVALIGNNLFSAKGVGSQIFCALDAFNLRMICYGASSHNLCLLVPAAEGEQVVQYLHRHLFES